MTSQNIKFYKFNNSTTSATKIATAKATEGAVIYLVDVRELWIGGSTPKLVIKGANDVTFANNVLTITHYDNAGSATTQTLDFSDVASAQATFAVFDHVYNLMGATDGTGVAAGTKVLDYSNTNYLENETTLVDADKALDAAIHDGTHKGAATGAVYDTQHLSQTWATVVSTNAIAADDTLDADIDKLDKKIAGLADEIIANEDVTQRAFSAVANSVGLEQDMSLDLSGDSTGIIDDDQTVKAALLDLANAVHNAGQVDDVKIADDSQGSPTSIVTNKVATITVDGTYNASTNKIATESTVSDAIDALDTQSDVQPVVYTAADSSNGAKLTFKGVSETDGVIAQGAGNTELQFAKVATSGDAADVDYTNTSSQMTATDVQGAIDELDNRIDALEGSFDVIKSTNAATTPAGVTWEDESTTPATTVTGTLAASDATFHKIYLVPVDSTGTNKYAEYITTKDTSGQTTTYAWERLGTIDVDLNGYVKTITLNGKQYAVDNNGSVNVTLDDVITGVTGETAISGGDTNYVKVAANTVKDTTNGTNVTTLSTTVQLEEVADALTKDSQATYASGHYVIENGKLVSAENKSTGDTYTISNNGLTTAADVAAYVESKTGEGISSLDADITSDDNAVATVEVVEVDGKITDVVVTNVSAGVTYTPSEQAGGATGASANLAAGSSAAAQAGAVTGADIAAIKSYVDDKSAMCWEEYE